MEFARLEVASADVEPWAAVITAMTVPAVAGRAALTREQALWVVSLYNSTDDLASTFRIMHLAAGSPEEWARTPPAGRELAATVPLSGERRNLRGGKILRRIDSYVALLAGQTQTQWIHEAIHGDDLHRNFLALMPYLRRVWGVGRLSAFEWCEFLHKVARVPVETTDGCLWESSGPRESIERLYAGGAPAPSAGWLSERAAECRQMLADQGVPLTWWDFETIICDFNVMRKGRYYPGKHLAMITEEIEGLPPALRTPLTAAYRAVIPPAWRDLPPGVDKALCQEYARTGRIRTPLETS